MSNTGEAAMGGFERRSGDDDMYPADPLFSRDVTSPLYAHDTAPGGLDVAPWVTAIPIGDYKQPPHSANEADQETPHTGVDTQPEWETPLPFTEVPLRAESTNNQFVREHVGAEYADPGDVPTVLDGKKIRMPHWPTRKQVKDPLVKEDVQGLDEKARSRARGSAAAAAMGAYASSWHGAAKEFANEWRFSVEAPVYEPENEPSNARKNIDAAKYNIQKATSETLPFVRLVGSTALVATGLVIAANESWTLNETVQPVDAFAVALAALYVYAINLRRHDAAVVIPETPRRVPAEKHAVVSRAKQFGVDVLSTLGNFIRAKDKVLEPPLRDKKGKTTVRERKRYAKEMVAQGARRTVRGVGLALLTGAQIYAWCKEAMVVGNTQPFDNVITFISTYTGLNVMKYMPVHPSKKKSKATKAIAASEHDPTATAQAETAKSSDTTESMQQNRRQENVTDAKTRETASPDYAEDEADTTNHAIPARPAFEV